MTFLRKLLGAKKATLDDQIMHVFEQADALLKSSLDLEDYKKLTPPIEALWIDLLTTNPSHTPIRTQAVVCAVAQFIGLHIWSEYGNQLPEETLIPLAQSVLIIELANQFTNLTPGGEMREFFGRLIAEQSLALQVSAPLALCSMGQEEQARQMVAETKRIALLPDDESLHAAMQRAEQTGFGQ